MVIQMAKAVGARVATTAGNQEKMELCKSLGADLVLNYNTNNIAESLKEFAPNGIDVWYETQREIYFEVALPLLAINGRMIIISGGATAPVFPNLGVFYPKNLSILGIAGFHFTAAEKHVANKDI